MFGGRKRVRVNFKTFQMVQIVFLSLFSQVSLTEVKVIRSLITKALFYRHVDFKSENNFFAVLTVS